MTSRSDCVQPFVWIKGCFNLKEGNDILTSLAITNNAPGICLQACGETIQLVALQLIVCACLKPGTFNHRPAIESQCSTPCEGDKTLKCGYLSQQISSWSVYERVSQTNLQTMKILPNATGCGFVLPSNGGVSYGMTFCNEQNSVICFNRVTGCEPAQGRYTWLDAVSECVNYNGILPYQTSCHTHASSYWVGLYRQKECLNIYTTTSHISSSLSDKPQRKTMPSSYPPTDKAVSSTPSELPPSYSPTGPAVSSTPLLSTLLNSETRNSNIDWSTHTEAASKLEGSVVTSSFKKETFSTTEISTLEGFQTSAETKSSLSISLLLSKNKSIPRKVFDRQMASAMPDSTTPTTFVSVSEKVSAAKEYLTPEKPEKLTIAFSAVGTIISTLLLILVMLLCRISRNLQKLLNSEKSQRRRSRNVSYIAKEADDKTITKLFSSRQTHNPVYMEYESNW